MITNNLKHLITLIQTNVKSTLRNRETVMFLIIFPLSFVAVFSFAYGGTTDTIVSNTQIGIINYDSGIPNDVTAFWNSSSPVNGNFYSDSYINFLSSIEYPNDDHTKMFDITIYDETTYDNAITDLEARDILALVILPENFSLGVLTSYQISFASNPVITNATDNWLNYPGIDFSAPLVIQGDRTLQDFTTTSSIITDITEQYYSFNITNENGIVIVTKGNLDSSSFSIFDYIFPGIVVFAIMLTLGTVTSIAFTDVESGTLSRLKLTNTSSSVYVLSLISSHLFNAVIQILVLYGAAMFLGFPYTTQILSAFIVSVLLSLSVCGIGFMISGIVNSANSGREMANIAGTPMAFLSGAFFVIPNPVLLENFFGENALKLFDLIPSTPAINLLRDQLLYGHSLTHNIYDLAMLSTLTVVYLILGLLLYKRKFLKLR